MSSLSAAGPRDLCVPSSSGRAGHVRGGGAQEPAGSHTPACGQGLVPLAAELTRPPSCLPGPRRGRVHPARPPSRTAVEGPRLEAPAGAAWIPGRPSPCRPCRTTEPLASSVFTEALGAKRPCAQACVFWQRRIVRCPSKPHREGAGCRAEQAPGQGGWRAWGTEHPGEASPCLGAASPA